MERRDFLALLGLGAFGAGLAACGGSSSPTNNPKADGFPLGAAAAAKTKPVPITVWHSMTSADLVALTSLADGFNSSQRDVHVDLVNQNSYVTTLSEFARALAKGSLPDLVQMDSAYLQQLIDTRKIVAVQEAVDADGYDLFDFLPAVNESFRVGGSLWAMPFNCFAQVLYYDKAAFNRVGLDPSSPPSDSSQMISVSQAFVGPGTERYGMSLKLSNQNLYQWMALGGQAVVNNGNGRTSRATAVTIGTSGGPAVFDWLSEMFRRKLAQEIPNGSYDNLLDIANKVAPMTIESSNSLGTITQIIRAGRYDTDLAIAPVPHVLPVSSTGGMIAQGGGMHLVRGSSAERLDGSWQFVKYLVEATSQAKWAAATGYIPVRKSAAQMTQVKTSWEANPGYRTAYEQLLSGPGTPVASVPVVGAAAGMIDAFESAMSAVAVGGDATAQLAKAVAESDLAISSYNAKLLRS
jgi:sn-glycerol 3-phosphate transport system substrate-binding protein